MTTNNRISTLISTLFPETSSVSYEVADGSTLGYTYFIEKDGEQTQYVLKLAKTDAESNLRFYRTDHTGQAAVDAMVVEATLLDCIAQQTAVPVPRVLQVKSSPEEGIPPYLLLERIPGTPLNIKTNMTSDAWQRCLTEIGRYLAELGNAFQFDGFGSLCDRDGTIVVADDQGTWPCWMDAQYNKYLARLGSTPLADLVPEINSLYQDRRDHLPYRPDPVLIHDDLHLANILVAPAANDGTITAVLDWEEAIAAPREFQAARMEYSLFVAGDTTTKAGLQAKEWFQNSYWDYSYGQQSQEYDICRTLYHLLIWLRMAGNLQYKDGVNKETKMTIEQALREELNDILTT